VSATWNGASGSGAPPGGGGVAVGAMGVAPPTPAGAAASLLGVAAAAGDSVGAAAGAVVPAAADGAPAFIPWVATTPPVTSMASPRAAVAAVIAPRRRVRVGPVAVVVTPGSGTASAAVGVRSSGSGGVVSCKLIVASFRVGCRGQRHHGKHRRQTRVVVHRLCFEANAIDAGRGHPAAGPHRPSRCPAHPRASGSWCWWTRGRPTSGWVLVPPQRWLRDPCRFGTE